MTLEEKLTKLAAAKKELNPDGKTYPVSRFLTSPITGGAMGGLGGAASGASTGMAAKMELEAAKKGRRVLTPGATKALKFLSRHGGKTGLLVGAGVGTGMTALHKLIQERGYRGRLAKKGYNIKKED